MNESTTIHPFEAAGLGLAPFRVVGFSVCKYQACQGAPVQPGASCDFCGTGIMNVFRIRSSDGREFKVGCDCVEKTADKKLTGEVKAFSAAHRAELTAARKEVARAKRAALAEKSAGTFLASRPELAEALKTDHYIVRDIASKLRRYGSISEAQVQLVVKLAGEAAKRAAEKAAEPTAVAAPRAEERITFEATILGVRSQESQYGTQLKALYQVKTADGAWKAWGTVPAALLRAEGELKGMRVKLCAGVEPSPKDPCFAFLRRPTVVSVAA